jgi:hypothetical protein
MRTTLTIDDDIAREINKTRLKRNGQSLKAVVNETLRNGLLFAAEAETKPRKKFKLTGRLLRSRMPFNFNKVHQLVEIVDEEDALK